MNGFLATCLFALFVASIVTVLWHNAWVLLTFVVPITVVAYIADRAQRGGEA